MGIKGLLPFLQPIHEPSHISIFMGQVIGIDAYCWLHRGIFGCSLELALEKPTSFYVAFFLKKVQQLLDAGIVPLLVFDGGKLGIKGNKEIERKQKRDQKMKEGRKLYNEGKTAQAIECFQLAIDITPKMASTVIKECKKMNVSSMVAPFEADAQLAFLFKQKVISGCITEDSDLLVFGCTRVFYKLDKNGNGVFINTDNLSKIPNYNVLFENPDNFLNICILAGCDYLDAIKGIGVSTACKLLKQYKNVEKVVQFLRYQKGCNIVPETYMRDFKKALFYFQHQWVFNHNTLCLSPVSGTDCTTLYINNEVYKKPIPDKIAFEISLGNLDPISYEPIGNNKFYEFKLLYESIDENRLKSLELDEGTIINKENKSNSVNISPPIISRSKSLLSSSMPVIKPFKSQYFEDFTNSFINESLDKLEDDNSRLKRSCLNDETDEDIETFAKSMCSTHSNSFSQPILPSKDVSRILVKKSLGVGLSRKSPKHFTVPINKSETPFINYTLDRFISKPPS